MAIEIKPINAFDGKGWLKHKSRPPGTKIDTIVLHATAGSNLSGAISTLRSKGFGYHYMIEKNGQVWKCAPMASNVAHAGESKGPQGRFCNQYSIGVCFVNENDGVRKPTAAQIASVKELLPMLAPGMANFKWLTTHYAITVKPNGTSRKTDPRLVDLVAIADAVGLTPWKPSYATKFAL